MKKKFNTNFIKPIDPPEKQELYDKILKKQRSNNSFLLFITEKDFKKAMGYWEGNEFELKLPIEIREQFVNITCSTFFTVSTKKRWRIR